MQFTIAKTVLENLLIHAHPFLEKKDVSQITSHVYLEATASTELTLKATDHEIGLIIQTQQLNVNEPGMATVGGKKLLDIVRILSDGDVMLKTENDVLEVSQAHSNFKLPMFNAREYPSFPTSEDKPKIAIESLTLINSLKKITPAIDTNNPKYELNGALIDIQHEKINFVSTDTRRLALVFVDNEGLDELSIIVPKKAIIEIQKLFTSTINIYYDETHLMIVSDQFTFFTKLINGKFPDYNRIIPKNTSINLSLPKSEMIGAIKQITTISSDMKLTFEADKIHFESLSDDNVKARTEIEVQLDIQEPYTLAINSRYLLDFLAQTSNTQFEIGLNEPTLPFLLKDGNFHSIVMPLVI